MERTALEHRQKRRWLWLAVIVLVLAVAGSSIWWWVLRPKQVRVQSDTVTLRNMQNQIFESGTVKPTQRQLVMPGSIPGPVGSVQVSVGQFVKKGATLLTCVHTTQSAALGQAESQVADAQRAYEDALQAYQSAPSAVRSYLKSSVDTSKNALDAANSAVSEAKAALEAQYVHAQISGKVIIANNDGIDATDTTQPYVEVVSDTKQVVTNVSEVDAVQLKSGMETILTCDAFPNRQWQGKITQIADYADTASDGTGQVGIVIGGLPQGFPVPLGYQVDIHITSETHKHVPTVPYSALVQSGTSYAVFTIEHGHVERKIVSLGVTSNTYVEVTKGLSAGEHVVNNPPANLQDGEAVVVS